MDALALATVEDVVDLRAELVVAHAEGVRVAARLIVGFEHEHTPSGVCEQRSHGQTCHPRTNDEIVVVSHRAMVSRLRGV